LCRLLALPPGVGKSEALDILLPMLGANTDGTGTVYLKNGEFIVQKYPFGLDKVIENKLPFLDFLPCDSWTLAHLRLATHGDSSNINNCHPFIGGSGKTCTIHNGIFSEMQVPKLIISKFYSINGETDSEIAANLIDILGPETFTNNFSGGVYFVLNKDGSLDVCYTYGQFVFRTFGKKEDCIYILASEFSNNYWTNQGIGTYHFDKDGTFRGRKEKKYEVENKTNYFNYFNNKKKTTKLFGKIPVRTDKDELNYCC